MMNTNRPQSNEFTLLNSLEYSLDKCIEIPMRSICWWEFAGALLLQKLEDDHHSVTFSAQTDTVLRIIYKGKSSGPNVIETFSRRKY